MTPCPYCKSSAPLFRVAEAYPVARSICSGCANHTQPLNDVNITIAIEGNRLAYEDAYRPDGKIYFPIRFCPCCGRRLGETHDSETMGSLWEKMITGKR